MTDLCPNQFPSVDPGKRRVCFIGENPAETEMRYHVPLCGSSGAKLNQVLGEVGLRRSACFVGNICQHYGKHFEFDWVGDEVQSGIATLLADLRQFKPNLVVTLGNAALHLFMAGNVQPETRLLKGKRIHKWTFGVTDHRGTLFPSSELTTAHMWVSDDPKTARVFDAPNAVETPPSLETESFTGENPGDGNHLTAPHAAQGDPARPVGYGDETGGGHSRACGCPGDGEAGAEAHPSQLTAGQARPFARQTDQRDGAREPFRVKCLATIHPSFIFKSSGDIFNLRHDLRRAAAECASPELALPELDFAYGPADTSKP